MLTLSFQGSTIKVDQPSEILVTSNGVTINPFGKPKAVRKLEAVAEAIGNALPDMNPKPAGRKKDPDSLRARIETFVNGHRKIGTPRREIQTLARDGFSNNPPTSVASYVSAALRGYQI